MAFPQGITECLKGCKVDNVEFKVSFSDDLLQKPISEYLPEIVGELTDNCMNKGAKSIIITLSGTSLRVEDDFIEPDPEKTLMLLNKIKNSGKLMSTKLKERKVPDCGPGGGMGIAKIVMGFLNKVGGNLEYSVNDGRIVAEVTWK